MAVLHRTVEGIPMRWLAHGEGPPVIFLHGIPTGPSLWRYVLPLVEGARSLAWELVGYGGSMAAGYGRDLSLARQADYLAAWMAAEGLDEAVLVGHDLGGGIAQIMAVRYPERVRGLVLMNSVSYDSWPVPSVKVLRALGPLVVHLPNAFIYCTLALFLLRGHDTPAQAQEALRVHWPHYADAPDAARAFIRQVEALDVQDTLAVADDLPRCGVPTQLVWGDADAFQPVAYGERLSHALGAPLDRIEGGKHFVPEDHPRRVAAAVMTLLERLAHAR